MDTSTLRKWRDKRPFRPFKIAMDNGQAHAVPHPDYLFLPPSGEPVIVAENSGQVHILDIPHISALTVLPRSRSRPKS